MLETDCLAEQENTAGVLPFPWAKVAVERFEHVVAELPGHPEHPVKLTWEGGRNCQFPSYGTESSYPIQGGTINWFGTDVKIRIHHAPEPADFEICCLIVGYSSDDYYRFSFDSPCDPLD